MYIDTDKVRKVISSATTVHVSEKLKDCLKYTSSIKMFVFGFFAQFEVISKLFQLYITVTSHPNHAPQCHNQYKPTS